MKEIKQSVWWKYLCPDYFGTHTCCLHWKSSLAGDLTAGIRSLQCCFLLLMLRLCWFCFLMLGFHLMDFLPSLQSVCLCFSSLQQSPLPCQKKTGKNTRISRLNDRKKNVCFFYIRTYKTSFRWFYICDFTIGCVVYSKRIYPETRLNVLWIIVLWELWVVFRF